MLAPLVRSLTLFAALALALPAWGQAPEDAGATVPQFKEGDTITFDTVDKLRPFLPAEFWDNRDFFLYEGMKLEIGPTQRDYSPAPEYTAATERFRGQARIGPDGSLENFTAGMPFPIEEIDCLGDPDAGVKIMWSFDYQWRGAGGSANFYYSYWDRGEELPLYYEGTGRTIYLAHRPEAQYLDQNNGDIFRGEKRKQAFGVQVDAPFDARGIMLMTYRYKTTDRPRSEAKNDDTWVYVPTLRRVRRISSAQRTDAVAGTDFTFDEQYEWRCLGEKQMIGPMNSKVKAFPYARDHNFGPYGLSYADDRWELRDTIIVRMTPKNADHPYHHKDIYLDKQTLTGLYSFAYDQKEELWKLLWHNKRWSEDTSLVGEWYVGWEGIEKPMDLMIVGDTIVNVQTGTGNRIEFWDRNGVPLKNKGKIRRFIDVGRLTKGR
jgi:hypothetical protein